MGSDEYGIEDTMYDLIRERSLNTKHPERYILGKPHADRARQFKPFAALRGYEELVQEAMEKADAHRDFSDLEEPC